MAKEAQLQRSKKSKVRLSGTKTIQVRTKIELAEQAERVFAGMGMTVPDGIRVFLQQSVNDGALPFRPRLAQPNATTIAAMQELEKGGGESFTDLDSLYSSWK